MSRTLLPPASRNDLWYHYGSGDTALVFVHGIFSDSRSCWLNTETGSYWPALVKSDPRFGDSGIYLGGYYTAPDAGDFNLSNCADGLLRDLMRPRLHMRPVLPPKSEGGNVSHSYRRLLFVCHSTGGIVVRKMLVDHFSTFSHLDAIGVALVASPSRGSVWAVLARPLSRVYGATLARTLEGGEALDDLDNQFRRRVEEQRHRAPAIFGWEAFENRFIFHWRWLPTSVRIVKRRSASVGYWGPPTHLARADHFTAVKPVDKNDPAHSFLVDAWNDLKAATGPDEPVEWTPEAKHSPEIVPTDLDETSSEQPPPRVSWRTLAFLAVLAIGAVAWMLARDPAPEVETCSLALVSVLDDHYDTDSAYRLLVKNRGTVLFSDELRGRLPHGVPDTGDEYKNWRNLAFPVQVGVGERGSRKLELYFELSGGRAEDFLGVSELVLTCPSGTYRQSITEQLHYGPGGTPTGILRIGQHAYWTVSLAQPTRQTSVVQAKKELVSIVQAKRGLVALALYSGPMDDSTTTEFSDAVKAFQRQHGIVADGVLGPATAHAIEQARLSAESSAASRQWTIERPPPPPPCPPEQDRACKGELLTSPAGAHRPECDQIRVIGNITDHRGKLVDFSVYAAGREFPCGVGRSGRSCPLTLHETSWQAVLGIVATTDADFVVTLLPVCP